LPFSHFSANQRKPQVSRDGKTEVVYDTQLRSFRRFNHSTAVGNLVSENIKYSFDS